METIVSIIVVVGFIVILLYYLRIKHLPRRTMDEKLEKEIIEKGLIHFTKREEACKIFESGYLIPGDELLENKKDEMYGKEKGLVWFFNGKFYDPEHPEKIKDSEEFNQKYIQRKGYDCAIKFYVAEEDLKKIKYNSKKIPGFVHKGRIPTSKLELIWELKK